MASLSNINGKFAVDSTGAIKFNNLTGTNNQVLIANTGASPTWVDVSTIIGGPYLPLTGGTLTGNLAINGTNTLSVGGTLTGTSATFAGNVTISQPTNGAEAKLILTSKSAAGNSRTGIVEYDADTEKIFFINESTTVAAMTSGGNVGIGIDSPSQKLVVQADWNGSLSNNQQLQIQGNTDTTLQLRLGYDTTNDYAEIAAIKSGTGYKNLILNRGGANVGIGTDSPTTKLHIGGTAPGDSIIRQDSTTSGTNWEIGERAAGKWQIFEDDGDTIVTTFMSSGNVGIGTESPNFKLHVSGTGGSDTLLRLENTTVNKYPNLRFTAAGAEYDIGVGGTGTATGYVHNFYIYDITNSASRITLTQAGNVGIGTQSPNKALTVYGGNDNGIWIDSQGAQYTSLAFGHNGTEKANIAWDNTNGYTSISTYANGHLAMATGGGIKAFLNSSGNFGIGDTAPTSLSANTSSLTVNSTRTDLSGALFQKSNGVVKFQQYWTTDGLQSDVIAGNYRWRSANNVKMALVNSTGTLTVVGDIVAFGNPSDKRLKENIKPIKNPLGKIKKLKGVTFDWKKSESILNIKEDYGFIAQDVKKIVPELVRKNENELLSMRHQGVIPILVEAIKELEARVKELENK